MKRGVLIGVEGFEPPIHGTKNRCLTAWLHPSKKPPSYAPFDFLSTV